MNNTSLPYRYRKLLEESSLRDGLLYITRASLHLLKTMNKGDDLFASYIESPKYEVSMLAYAVSELMLNANGRKKFGFEEFEACIGLYNYDSGIDATNFVTSREFRPIQLLLQNAYPQIAIAKGPNIFNRFGRFAILYERLANEPEGSKIRRIIDNYPILVGNGLSLKEFILGGFALFALVLYNGGELNLNNFLDLQIGEVVFNKDHLKKFVEALATSPHEYSTNIKRVHKDEWRQHSLLNPLLAHPVIKVDEDYFVPVPQLLFDRCSVGIHDSLREHFKNSPKEMEAYQNAFASAFENYVEALIRHINKDWKIWEEVEYRVPNSKFGNIKSCDYIVLDGEDLLLIECKTTPLPKHTKTFMNEQKFNNTIKGEIQKGIENILRTTKHLKEGSLVLEGLSLSSVKRIGAVVVTLDDYLLRPVQFTIHNPADGSVFESNTIPIRQYVFEICRKQLAKSHFVSETDLMNFPSDYIQVVSVEDFENHLGAVHSKGSKLWNIATGTVLNSIHPLLQIKFDNYWRRVLLVEKP
jgi:hypothetical protein